MGKNFIQNNVLKNISDRNPCTEKLGNFKSNYIYMVQNGKQKLNIALPSVDELCKLVAMIQTSLYQFILLQ